MCNRIGAKLGLPPVRTSKARGKDKDLPSCAYWPEDVRPDDYYQGANRKEAWERDEPNPGAAPLSATAALRDLVARFGMEAVTVALQTIREEDPG